METWLLYIICRITTLAKLTTIFAVNFMDTIGVRRRKRLFYAAWNGRELAPKKKSMPQAQIPACVFSEKSCSAPFSLSACGRTFQVDYQDLGPSNQVLKVLLWHISKTDLLLFFILIMLASLLIIFIMSSWLKFILTIDLQVYFFWVLFPYIPGLNYVAK